MDTAIVLLSGGWESVACLIKAKKRWAAPAALFVNYGQPYLEQEQRAVLEITNALKVDLIVEIVSKPLRKGKVFKGRNDSFLRLANKYKPKEIYFGARAPLKIFDKYEDSNWQFAQQMSVELNTKIRTPIIMWPKIMVCSFVKRHIDSQYIFSSEGFEYEHSQ